ncbi:MAG: glycosyltransferase [Solirubrobacteraceae bacterium]
MTRVLLVHQPTDGGVARHVADLFTGLRARGVDAMLCGPDAPTSLRGRLTPDDRQPLALQRAVAPGRDSGAVRDLARIVARLRPDAVHAHSSKAGAVARVARLAHPRTPVLYTPHGYAMAGFFERGLERTAYREAERGLGLLTSRVVAVCESEARLARTVTAARHVRVVHNGIDPPGAGEADARVTTLRQRGPVVCTVAQLRPGKGIETLIDAWPGVRIRHPAAQLAIAGDGVLRAALERRASTLDVGDSVHFLGEHPDPIAVLRAADIFALASWAEAFPYAILEAMALGLPIVASDVGGIGEAIVSGANGMLIPPRQAHVLGAALTQLAGDPEQRRRLGAAALDSVTRRFSISAMVSGTLAVYEEATGHR